MDAGHRTLPHTADLALEAWAPTMGQCIAEAVHALVESFADVRAAIPDQAVTLTVEEAADEDLLVRVLNDVIYQLEVHGRVPVDISVTEPEEDPAGPGVRAEVRFATAPVGGTELTGAIPKAVTLHELSLTHTDDHWRCHVTVDI
jgi:SHS2 domain-containing protein